MAAQADKHKCHPNWNSPPPHYQSNKPGMSTKLGRVGGGFWLRLEGSLMPHNINLILLSPKPAYLLSLTFRKRHQFSISKYYSDDKLTENN